MHEWQNKPELVSEMMAVSTDMEQTENLELVWSKIAEAGRKGRAKAAVARQAIFKLSEQGTADSREILELIMAYRDVTPERLPLLARYKRPAMSTFRRKPPQRSAISSIHKPFAKERIRSVFDQMIVGRPIIANQGEVYGIIAERPLLRLHENLEAINGNFVITVDRMESPHDSAISSHPIPLTETFETDISQSAELTRLAVGQVAISRLARVGFEGVHGVPRGNPLYHDNLMSLRRIHAAISDLDEQGVIKSIDLTRLSKQIDTGQAHRDYTDYWSGLRATEESRVMQNFTPLR